jgi:hypothetical protein
MDHLLQQTVSCYRVETAFQCTQHFVELLQAANYGTVTLVRSSPNVTSGENRYRAPFEMLTLVPIQRNL